jgi:hypothetical protein
MHNARDLTRFSLRRRHSSDVVLVSNEELPTHTTAPMLMLHWTQFELRQASNDIEGN